MHNDMLQLLQHAGRRDSKAEQSLVGGERGEQKAEFFVHKYLIDVACNDTVINAACPTNVSKGVNSIFQIQASL